MKLQPNLLYKDDIKTIEQPFQLSVNRVFEVLSVRDKVTLTEYNEDMDHRSVLKNIKDNEKNKEETLNREIRINKDKYDMYINGPALCVSTDLKIFWHLLSRKEIEDEISIIDFCKELEIANKKENHKTIIESFYRLSNNNIQFATEDTTMFFKMVTYKKENEMIKYSFNEDFLKLVNSKNGLERHNIKTLSNLKIGISKVLYTTLVSNKYKKDGSRNFTIQELAELLDVKITKKSKFKEKIKKSLIELKDNNIITDFIMKLDDVIIYNRHNKLKTIETTEEEKEVSEVKSEDIKPKIKANVTSGHNQETLNALREDDINNINDCFQYGI